MRAIAGHCAGDGVEAGKRTTDASIVFQAVETGIDRDGRAIEVVAELHAVAGERGDIAPASTLTKAVHAQPHSAAFAADKPAVRKIVARGKAAASDVAAVEARN